MSAFQRVDGRAGRVYRLKPPLVPEQLELASVTTILGGGLPKPAIAAWNSKMVAEAAVQQRDEWDGLNDGEAIRWLKQAPTRHMKAAGTRGTRIHHTAEMVLQGADPGKSVHGQHVARWRDEWVDELVAVEQTMINVVHQWAGTADMIFRDRQGTVWLADWKTGKGVYGEMGVQLAAYANATHWIRDPHNDPALVAPPMIDRLAVLHLTDDGITVHEPTATIADLWVTFRAAHRIWQDQRAHKLAELEGPPRPTCDELLAHLVARCRHAHQHNKTFGPQLAAAWPTGYPRLKDGGLSLAQLRHADQIITILERDLDVPFGPTPTWKSPKQNSPTTKGEAAA